jgi:signal transduction histidine kinase
LRDRTERLANDVHRMTHQLHPAALEHLGLISALRSHCYEFTENEGIAVQFQVINELGPVQQEAAVCLYRVAQEALRNVSKHSRADEAWVKIGRDGDEIRLSIVDKGIGFDGESPNAGKCLGLISMRERVRLLSGSVNIKSALGEGTRVEVWVPIESRKPTKWKRRNDAKTKAAAGG